MAGANMKAIKSRIKSVESTMSITKAMELVASSKLRRAKQREEAVKPYYTVLFETIIDFVSFSKEKSVFVCETDDASAACYIVIAGDRGLAGGYNNNLFRLVRDHIRPGDCIVPVGRKSVEYYTRTGNECLSTVYNSVADIGVHETLEIGDMVCRRFAEGKIGRVYVVFTEFLSMITQEPCLLPLLPLDRETLKWDDMVPKPKTTLTSPDTIYEPSLEYVLDRMVPQYVSGMIYGAVCEAIASEFAARRTAMNAANKNADEMISALTLKYNRARQSMITQEITEIVAASDAL